MLQIVRKSSRSSAIIFLKTAPDPGAHAPRVCNEPLQQKTLFIDQVAYSRLGDAVLKTGLILFLMEMGIQTKGGASPGRRGSSKIIPRLQKLHAGYISKNSSGRVAGRRACGEMAKIRFSLIRSKP